MWNLLPVGQLTSRLFATAGRSESSGQRVIFNPSLKRDLLAAAREASQRGSRAGLSRVCNRHRRRLATGASSPQVPSARAVTAC